MGDRDSHGDSGDAGTPRSLFHIVKHLVPTAADYLSGAERGQRKPNDPTRERYWHGFSTFDTLELARIQARRYPKLGAFFAEIAVADVVGVEYQQMFDPGHYPMWAEPEKCVQNVVNLYPVWGPEEEAYDTPTL